MKVMFVMKLTDMSRDNGELLLRRMRGRSPLKLQREITVINHSVVINIIITIIIIITKFFLRRSSLFQSEFSAEGI
jgi:hypothetical protein